MTPPVPTIASRIRERALSDPRGVAMREKSLGIWQETSWAAYADLVELAAHGLLALGARVGDRIAIQADNRREWLVGDAGAVAARAVAIGLDPADPPATLEQVLRDSATRILVAEDQEQVDKALAIRAALPELRWIVYIEPRGVRDYADPALVWWPDLLARGDEHRAAHPGQLDELAREARDDDPATLTYAAADGPAPSVITLRDVNLALAKRGERWLHADPCPSDFVLSHLPLRHIHERLGSGWLNAHAGVQVHFGEPSADPLQTLREVRPSLFLGTPRTWERMRAEIGVPAPPASRLARRALRARLGMSKCRSALSTEPLTGDLAAWCGGLGLPVREARVELSGAVA